MCPTASPRPTTRKDWRPRWRTWPATCTRSTLDRPSPASASAELGCQHTELVPVRIFHGDRTVMAEGRLVRRRPAARCYLPTGKGSSHLNQERIMLKSAAVLTIFLVLGVGGAVSAAAPEDGFSCEYTNKAEVKAKEGSSGAPSGGPAR